MTAPLAKDYNGKLANQPNIIDKRLAKEYNVMSEELMSTRQAAEYLQMPLATLKWYVTRGDIAPQKIGRTLIFTRAQLDAFKALPRRPIGRPKKPKADTDGPPTD